MRLAAELEAATFLAIDLDEVDALSEARVTHTTPEDVLQGVAALFIQSSDARAGEAAASSQASTATPVAADGP